MTRESSDLVSQRFKIKLSWPPIVHNILIPLWWHSQTKQRIIKREREYKCNACGITVAVTQQNDENEISIHGNTDLDGPNTLSESTVSNTELSEFFGPQQVPGRELSEFLSAY